MFRAVHCYIMLLSLFISHHSCCLYICPHLVFSVRKVALKSGDTPVDSECPLIGRARVFTESGVVLDCMLNQVS